MAPDMPDSHRSTDQPRSSPAPAGRSRNRRRWLLFGVLVVLALWLAAGWAVADDRLPPGTVVAGVAVGGLDPAAAERTLRRELEPALARPVRVVAGDLETDIDPRSVGLQVDLQASVDQARRGPTWNPVTLLRSWWGSPRSYPAVVVSRDDDLQAAVRRLAARVDRPAVEGGVRLTPRGAVPQWPRPGTRLDVEEAVSAITEQFPRAGTVTLTPDTVTPDVTGDAVRTALTDLAKPAVSAPVSFRFRGEETTVPVDAIADMVTVVADSGRLTLRVAPGALRDRLRPLLSAAAVRPVSATVRIVEGRPEVVPGVPGRVIDRAAADATFLRLLTERGERRAVLPTTPQRPQRSTADVKALRIREVVSEFTTFYPHADYRNINIGRAAELIDGTLVEPGEVFSFNRTVGERTRERGFTEGFIISDGVFKEDLGGGVSQVATTTFNAVFFAGLEDIEHKPHSFYIDRYPMGREATVAWPTVDLRFRNDTDNGVLITAVRNPSTPTQQGSITVRFWSTKVWDITARSSGPYNFTQPGARTIAGPECVPSDGVTGFDVDVTRIFRRAGESEVVRRELFHTRYAAADAVTCPDPQS